MLTEHIGDIFDSQRSMIAIPVNTVCAMGAGLAKECCVRYPHVERPYKQFCQSGRLVPGKPRCTLLETDPTRWVMFFPTKEDFRDPSRITYIRDGLRFILDNHVKFLSPGGIAFPRLGCGLGRLSWDDVRIYIAAFATLVDFPVEVWSL
jgi:O-acetyl-ADP-ribose deacetylase (regulator of RNase III)